MPENHIIIDKAIELVKNGEPTKAKFYLLESCGSDDSLYAFRVGLVMGSLHQLDEELAHSFINQLNEELTRWYSGQVN